MPPGNKPGPNSATTNKSGRSAMHPRMRMTWKRALKIERVARLSADPAGFSNVQIANMLNCDPQTIVLIRQTPEYHAKMIEISTGVVSQYDAQLRENVDNMRDELRSMVPSAMMVIRNAVHGKYGSNLQFKAALEIADREGTNAKVSKSTVAHEVKVPMGVDPKIASDLMSLLSAAPITGSDPNNAGGGFTQTAAEALAQQTAMRNDSTTLLDTIDTTKSKPN